MREKHYTMADKPKILESELFWNVLVVFRLISFCCWITVVANLTHSYNHMEAIVSSYVSLDLLAMADR